MDMLTRSPRGPVECPWVPSRKEELYNRTYIRLMYCKDGALESGVCASEIFMSGKG